MDWKEFHGAKSNRSKYFYSYTNQHLKVKNKVGPLINEKEETISEPFGMAEILRKQYESTFTQPQEEVGEDQAEEEEEELGERHMADLHITYVDMLEAIDCLKMTSGPWPDGVSAILLKKAKTTITPHISPQGCQPKSYVRLKN